MKGRGRKFFWSLNTKYRGLLICFRCPALNCQGPQSSALRGNIVMWNLAKSIPALRHHSQAFLDIPSHSYSFYFLLSPPLSSVHHSVHSSIPHHSPYCFPASPLLPMFHGYPSSVLSHVLLFPVFCFYPSFAVSGHLAGQNSFILLACFDLQIHYHF